MKTYPYYIIAQENQNNKAFLEDYILNHIDQLFQIARTDGGILFRGFDIKNADDFHDIIKILHPYFSSYTGGDSPRTKVKNNIYTSTEYPPDQFISMHQEKSFSNHYPNFLYFFCEIEPQRGGETPILDSRLVYKLLDKEIINKFQTKKLKYVMNLHSGYGIGKSWQQTFEVDTKSDLESILDSLKINYRWKTQDLIEISEIVCPIIRHPITQDFIFFSQAHQWHRSALGLEMESALSEVMSVDDFYHNCYYGDGSELEIEYLDQIRKVLDEHKTVFKWMQGDLLMLDNIVSMHSRNPFEGLRRILVAMS